MVDDGREVEPELGVADNVVAQPVLDVFGYGTPDGRLKRCIQRSHGRHRVLRPACRNFSWM